MPAFMSQSVKAFLFSSDSKPSRFTNTETLYTPTFKDKVTTLRSYLNIDNLLNIHAPNIPIDSLSQHDIDQEKQDCVFRLGHSTVLMKLDGKILLTDPVMTERASPLDWAGPKRCHALPISIADLPTIDICMISHDHYDHLDKSTIKQIHHKVTRFIVPARVGGHLLEWGVPSYKVTEFNWWQSHTIGTIRFVFAPAQHFSGRSYKARDTSLWGSWIIQASGANIYFSGDSGYFSGFKDIGDRFGPFDLTLMETGAYDEKWASIHMFPEQSVQAHLDVKGRYMLPIHNSTFDLSYHAWNEPLKRAQQEAKRQGINMICPKIGAKIVLSELGIAPTPGTWWES
ncbi:MBL fold metallo-hydrolase [Vibrio sp. 10N.261.51.F12]|uniref:MBL fold metallo-hydrolase n=1 Tax=Vibrio sp. 10N.261.51.F12 TaxID=3229679 RepID=UPI0035530875